MKISSTLISFILGLTLIGYLSLFSSCLDEIDFAKADTTIAESIAIQGKIVKSNPSFVSISIRTINNLQKVSRLLDVADVTVEDESGNMVNIPTNSVGIFYLELAEDHPFKVAYGKSYKVNVSTLDGRNYSSALEELLPVPIPEELKVVRNQIEVLDPNGNNMLFDQLTYTINTPYKAPNSMENARLLWELISTYKFSDTPDAYTRLNCAPIKIELEPKTCFITDAPVDNYITLDGTKLSGDGVDNIELLTTGLNFTYAEGFYLTVLQQSLSESAFIYWNQISNIVSQTGTGILFQPSGGKIITNLVNTEDPKDDVFGYFYATEQITRRVYISPEFADNQPKICPTPIKYSSKKADPDCCNCLAVGVSSIRKPSWWTE